MLTTKGRKFPVEILTTDEVHLLLKKCSNRAPTGIRNRALIVCLWRCGLRVSEALALHPKDIDHKAGSLRVLRGKGNKSRTVGIDPQALAVLDRWLEKRASMKISGRCPVFCTLDGQPVAPVYVRNMIRRIGHKAGIEKRCHPHGLRHTHASELRSEGIDIGIIARQLGHSSIATTSRYLEHIAPTQVLATIRNRSW
jgi:site-specific recombinase XerD